MNIEAAKAVADAIRTSLGPRGMDKMVRSSCTGCCTELFNGEGSMHLYPARMLKTRLENCTLAW